MMFNRYLGGKTTLNQWKQIILLIGLFVLFDSGFNYVNWNPTYAGWLQKIVTIVLVLFLFFGRIIKPSCHFRNEVMVLMLLPFLSIINSFTYYNQSLYNSVLALSASFVWIIYFLLHRYKVSEAVVMKTFLIVSLFVVAVQIIQQFTYPNALFGVSSPNDLENGITEIAEQRNGIWRFRMHHNGYYTVPILFAAWYWFRQHFDRSLIPFVALFLVSIYLTLTRQVMAACILTIFCSFFMGRKLKASSVVLVVILALGLYYSYDVLFSKLAEQTKEDSTDDNIRLLAASYFWNESLKSPLTFLFGYGLPNGGQFQQHMNVLTKIFRYFTTDVGVIGQIYESGVLYVVSFFSLVCRVFFKLKNLIPVYVRMFLLFTVAMSPMIFPLVGSSSLLIWAMLLYVCDLHINHSPLALETTQNEMNKF